MIMHAPGRSCDLCRATCSSARLAPTLECVDTNYHKTLRTKARGGGAGNSSDATPPPPKERATGRDAARGVRPDMLAPPHQTLFATAPADLYSTVEGSHGKGESTT